MIAFFGQGGLGNQLFQYAAARSLALRLGEELVLDPYWFNHPLSGETARPLELLRYAVQMRVATPAEQRRWRFQRSRWVRRLPFLQSSGVLRETPAAYTSAFERAGRDTYMIGFWQSERYFKEHRAKLLAELTPLAPPSTRDAALLETMRDGTPVSLHVRRGDYVTSPSAAAFHGVCSIDYYERALDHIRRRVQRPTLYIFSDDPAWTRENLRTDLPCHYVDHNGPENAFQDLRLMSRCTHHVTANSSFSWWGAWLSTAKDGIVVAPRAWFASGLATANLVPDDWVRL
jgi:hypothetical protein